MGNVNSRNDQFLVPPGFMPPIYPGYPQYSRPTTWNPFKQCQMRKREKAMREYLYTTPMILQYPGAFAGAQKFIAVHNSHRMIDTYPSHPTRAEPGSAWDPTGTCCYPRRPCHYQWSNYPGAHFCPNGSFGCSRSSSRGRRHWRHHGYPIPDDADDRSGHFRLLYFSRFAR